MPPFRALVSQTLASFSYLLLSLFVHIQCSGILFPRKLREMHWNDLTQSRDDFRTFLDINLRSLLSVVTVSLAGPWLASIAGGNITAPGTDLNTTRPTAEAWFRRQLQKICYMYLAFFALRTFTSSLRSPTWTKPLVTWHMMPVIWWSELMFWSASILCACIVLVKRLHGPVSRYLKPWMELFGSSSKRSMSWCQHRIVNLSLHQSQTVIATQHFMQTRWVEVSTSTIALYSAIYTLLTFSTVPEGLTTTYDTDRRQTVACMKAWFGLYCTINLGAVALALWLELLEHGDSIAAPTRKSLSLRNEKSGRKMKTTEVSPQPESLLTVHHPDKDDKHAAEVKLRIDYLLADISNIVRNLGSTNTTLKHISEDEEWVAVNKDEASDTPSGNIGPDIKKEHKEQKGWFVPGRRAARCSTLPNEGLLLIIISLTQTDS